MAFRKTSTAARADDTVADLVARGNELKTEATRLEQHLRDVEDGIAGERSRSLDDAAAELLKDGLPALNGVAELTDQLDAVASKLRIVRRALEMNRRQLAEAEAAQRRRATESMRDEYVGIVREMKSAILALRAAEAKNAAFADRLEAAGGSFGCGVIRPMAIDAGQFDTWLEDAALHFAL